MDWNAQSSNLRRERPTQKQVYIFLVAFFESVQLNHLLSKTLNFGWNSHRKLPSTSTVYDFFEIIPI